MSRWRHFVVAATVIGLSAGKVCALNVVNNGDEVDGWDIVFPSGMSVLQDNSQSNLTLQISGTLKSLTSQDITFVQDAYDASPTVTIQTQTLANDSGEAIGGLKDKIATRLEGASAMPSITQSFSLDDPALTKFTGQTTIAGGVKFTGTLAENATTSLGGGSDESLVINTSPAASSEMKDVFLLQVTPVLAVSSQPTSQGAVLSLSTTPGAGDIAPSTNSLGALSMTGGGGVTQAIVNFSGGSGSNFAVVTPQSTTANVKVTGISQPSAPEVYALAVDSGGVLASGTGLNNAIADLQSAVSTANPGGVVEALSSGTPNITGKFSPADWNVEVVYPAGVASQAYFNWDFSADTVDPGLSITAVGIVPEPTGIGLLVLCGMGLLARRRRASK